MAACMAKIDWNKRCPRTAKRGRKYCRWHDPEDESWRKVFDELEKATPEEKTEIVLGLIADHPEHQLMLPMRDNRRADLSGIDLSREKLLQKKNLPSQLSSWLAEAPGREITFISANLQGADLSFANLSGTNLSAANLQDAGLFGANLQNTALMSADLRGAVLIANFKGANLVAARLQGVDLYDADDLSGIHIHEAWLDRTRMRREQLGNAIGEELEGYYAGAKQGYLALKQNFDDLGDYEAASWAYRKERRMEKLEAREKGRHALRKFEGYTDNQGNKIPKKRDWREGVANYFKFFSDIFIEWLCDYGESIWRVIVWMVTLLFIIGPLLFSGLGGFVWSKDLAREYFNLSFLDRLWFWYYHYLLYTLDALTTASFSDLRPANDAVKLASGLFAITGIFLAGLLGFVAGNRIRRS